MWQEFYTNRTVAFEHLGNTFGQSAQVSIIPELGWSFISLVNVAGEHHISHGLLRRLWGVYLNSNTSLVVDQKLNGYFQNTRIIHNGFLSYSALMIYYEVYADEDNNQIHFQYVPYNVTEENLFTRYDMDQEDPPFGLMHLSYTYNQQGEITGIFSPYVQLKKISLDSVLRIKRAVITFNLAFMCNFIPLIMIIVVFCSLGKNVKRSKLLKYLIINIILFVIVLNEAALVPVITAYQNIIGVRDIIQMVVIFLIVLIVLKVILMVTALVVFIWELIVTKNRKDKYIVVEDLLPENQITPDMKEFRPPTWTRALTFASFAISCAAGIIINICFKIMDVYRV